MTEPVEVDAHKSCVSFVSTVGCIDAVVLCLSGYGWSLVCMQLLRLERVQSIQYGPGLAVPFKGWLV